jgi:hypothetical protein
LLSFLYFWSNFVEIKKFEQKYYLVFDDFEEKNLNPSINNYFSISGSKFCQMVIGHKKVFFLESFSEIFPEITSGEPKW